MKGKYRIVIVASAVLVAWMGITGPGICIFVDGPQPGWLGSENGCGPTVTYEIQKALGILWYEPGPKMMGDPTNPRVTYEGERSFLTLFPYIENYSVPFDYEGRIDYDLLIKRLLPPIFQDKLGDMGVDVEVTQMVLLYGVQVLMYEESSYQCGYVIDDDMQVYWLEGSINKHEIYGVRVFTENPMPCRPNTTSCWCDAQTRAEEQLLSFEEAPLSPEEEQAVVSYVHGYLKDNTNLNSYEYQVGRYHIDYGDENIIAFCGMFDKETGLQFFEGSVNLATGENGFGLEERLSPLCVIAEDAAWNSFD